MSAVHRPPLLLSERREALLARIHIARGQTADAGRLLAQDLQALGRSQRAIQYGWKLFKASAVAAGVIWSFNASSSLGRGRRFVTMAISLLSTMRALRKVGGLLIQTTHISERQGYPSWAKSPNSLTMSR